MVQAYTIGPVHVLLAIIFLVDVIAIVTLLGETSSNYRKLIWMIIIIVFPIIGATLYLLIGRVKLSLSLRTDKSQYYSGEPIRMNLRVCNHSKKEGILHFNDSKRFDFIIYKSGNRIWSWSSDKEFVHVAAEEKLIPGESKVFMIDFTEELKPGIYEITGILFGVPTPLSSSCMITIRSTETLRPNAEPALADLSNDALEPTDESLAS